MRTRWSQHDDRPRKGAFTSSACSGRVLVCDATMRLARWNEPAHTNIPPPGKKGREWEARERVGCGGERAMLIWMECDAIIVVYIPITRCPVQRTKVSARTEQKLLTFQQSYLFARNTYRGCSFFLAFLYQKESPRDSSLRIGRSKLSQNIVFSDVKIRNVRFYKQFFFTNNKIKVLLNLWVECCTVRT